MGCLTKSYSLQIWLFFKVRPNFMKNSSPVITLHIMTQVWPFPCVNQSKNSYPLTNSILPPPRIDDISRKSHSHEIMSPFFPNFNSICFCLLIMFYAIYVDKFSVIDQCNKNIYKSWDPSCWNNWQVHISKIYNNKMSNK